MSWASCEHFFRAEDSEQLVVEDATSRYTTWAGPRTSVGLDLISSQLKSFLMSITSLQYLPPLCR